MSRACGVRMSGHRVQGFGVQVLRVICAKMPQSLVQSPYIVEHLQEPFKERLSKMAQPYHVAEVDSPMNSTKMVQALGNTFKGSRRPGFKVFGLGIQGFTWVLGFSVCFYARGTTRGSGFPAFYRQLKHAYPNEGYHGSLRILFSPPTHQVTSQELFKAPFNCSITIAGTRNLMLVLQGQQRLGGV